MSKFAIRLLTLAVYATALMAVPMVTPARATADSKHVKKSASKKKTLNSPSAHDPWSPDHANEDPDRKPAGGGY
jgi:hypothetical protein